VTIVKMSDEQRQAWVDKLPDIAGEWAADLDGRGLPAKDFLKAYMQGLRDRGEKPMRNWGE
jgi:hypothetical protein